MRNLLKDVQSHIILYVESKHLKEQQNRSSKLIQRKKLITTRGEEGGEMGKNGGGD